jgi:hypothetical protein
MKWIIALGLALILFPLVVAAIVASNGSRRGKGRMAGATLAIGLAFSAIFDPAQAAAIETIKKKKEIGDAESGEGGEKLD